MRIKLLIATDDSDYGEHLSAELSVHHSGVVETVVCSTAERLREVLAARKFDAALLEAHMTEGLDLSPITQPLLLKGTDGGAGDAGSAVNAGSGFTKLREIKKYQRVTSIVSDVLEQSARVSTVRCDDPLRARLTAVWSPAGGVGKTTVALAYAAKKVLEGKLVLYLNLESFSSVPAYFAETGKSISSLFEMLESNEGNAQMLIQSIECRDSEGISYFCRPVNYDDMNVLSSGNIASLLNACSRLTDELVVDLTCLCDERTARVFDAADRIFIVTDPSETARIKVSQFTSQHGIYRSIKEKVVFVENRSEGAGKPAPESTLRLPAVRTGDHTTAYKTLSAYF